MARRRPVEVAREPGEDPDVLPRRLVDRRAMSQEEYWTRCIEVRTWLTTHGIDNADTNAVRLVFLAAYAAHGLRGIDALDRVLLRAERGEPTEHWADKP